MVCLSSIEEKVSFFPPSRFTHTLIRVGLMTGNLEEYLLLVFVHNAVCSWCSSMSSNLGLLRFQLQKPWGPRKKKQVLKRWNRGKQRRVKNYGAPVRSVEFQTFFGALWYPDGKLGVWCACLIFPSNQIGCTLLVCLFVRVRCVSLHKLDNWISVDQWHEQALN